MIICLFPYSESPVQTSSPQLDLSNSIHGYDCIYIPRPTYKGSSKKLRLWKNVNTCKNDVSEMQVTSFNLGQYQHLVTCHCVWPTGMFLHIYGIKKLTMNQYLKERKQFGEAWAHISTWKPCGRSESLFDQDLLCVGCSQNHFCYIACVKATYLTTKRLLI